MANEYAIVTEYNVRDNSTYTNIKKFNTEAEAKEFILLLTDARAKAIEAYNKEQKDQLLELERAAATRSMSNKI